MALDTVFTWGPANVTTLLATTASVREKKLYDNIFTRIPLWFWLRKKTMVKKQSGASIVVPLMYGKNATAKSYNGFDTLDTTPQDGISASQAKWAQYATTVSVSGRELMQNQGQEAIISLVDSKFTQAEMSLADKLDIDAFAASQVANTDLIPVPTIVDQTTSIQDISKSSYTWWKSQSKASGSFAAQGTSDLRNLYNTILNQGGQDQAGAPDFGITTQSVLESYEATLEPQKRYSDSEMASAGFENLAFKKATLTFDGNAPSGKLYLLNSSAVYLVVHSQRDFATTKWIQPTNQDAMVKQVLFMGQIVANNIRRTGVMTGITA